MTDLSRHSAEIVSRYSHDRWSLRKIAATYSATIWEVRELLRAEAVEMKPRGRPVGVTQPVANPSSPPPGPKPFHPAHLDSDHVKAVLSSLGGLSFPVLPERRPA